MEKTDRVRSSGLWRLTYSRLIYPRSRFTLAARSGAHRSLLGLLLETLHSFAHGIRPRTIRFLLQKHL
jgi:hypothetical protein